MQSVFFTLTTVVFISMAFLISHQNESKVPPEGGGRFPLCISDPFYFEFSEEDMGQIITGYKTHLLDL